jgi:hypothetical protein
MKLSVDADGTFFSQYGREKALIGGTETMGYWMSRFNVDQVWRQLVQDHPHIATATYYFCQKVMDDFPAYRQEELFSKQGE